MKKLLVFMAIVLSGLLTGYYSEQIYNLMLPNGNSAVVSSSPAKSGQTPESEAENSSPQFISKDEAISAVKNFRPVKEVIKKAGASRISMDFLADREPTADFPVWLIEVKEHHPDKVPESRYYQVDASTGRVLDLTADELKIAGVSFDMSRGEALKILGRPQKSKRQYDKVRRQSIRTDTYRGVEITYSTGNRVIKVTVSDARYPGPRGIKKGLTRKELMLMLGKPTTVMTDLMEYRPADDSKSWFVVNLDSTGSTVAGFSMEKAL